VSFPGGVLSLGVYLRDPNSSSCTGASCAGASTRIQSAGDVLLTGTFVSEGSEAGALWRLAMSQSTTRAAQRTGVYGNARPARSSTGALVRGEVSVARATTRYMYM